MKDVKVAEVGPTPESSDIEKKLIESYKATIDAEESIERVEAVLMELRQTEVDLCFTDKLLENLNEVTIIVSDIETKMTESLSSALSGTADGANVKISSGVEQYTSTGIILKRALLLKYKMKKILLVVKRTIAQTEKTVLEWTLNGAGSNLLTPIQGILGALAATAGVINTIIGILGGILSVLDSMVTINVKSASAALFMTPKSFMKQDITISNANMSTTNNIPAIIDKAITKAEEAIKEEIGKLKKESVKAAGAESAASVSDGAFKYSGIPSFPKFDPAKVRYLVNAIMMTLLDADAIPRYEKLTFLNPRFAAYMITGFQPKAAASFGIPGM